MALSSYISEKDKKNFNFYLKNVTLFYKKAGMYYKMDGSIKHCPFCGGTELKEIECFSKQKADKINGVLTKCPRPRRFMHCAGDDGCGGFFLLPEYFLSEKEQKERYLLHNNSLEDEGYRLFLKRFADTALSRIEELLGRPPDSVFDYGCGNGSLIALLESYKQNRLLSEKTEIRGSDPFFAPDIPFFDGGADAVFCLEVAEHFENPDEGFAGLAAACSAGGYAAVQTLFAPENGNGAGFKNAEERFRAWWYKEDTTHVSFYTIKALKACALRAGFEYCGTYNNCSILRAALPR